MTDEAQVKGGATIRWYWLLLGVVSAFGFVNICLELILIFAR